MGQKVHPHGFRLGYIYDWNSKWYADKNYTELLHEDLQIRRTIEKMLPDAGICRVEIERNANQVTVTIHTARPGIVIGRGGQRVDELRGRLEKVSGRRIRVNINEVRLPEVEAPLVARAVAEQIERRVSHRRAIKQAAMRAMQRGAQGVRIKISGRLGGSDMSRKDQERQGRVPLHTLKADVDYGTAEARTTLGRIGVKVWIYKGDKIAERTAPPRSALEKAEAGGQEQPAEPAVPAAPADGVQPVIEAEAAAAEAASAKAARAEAATVEVAPVETPTAEAAPAKAAPAKAARAEVAPVETPPVEAAPAKAAPARAARAKAAPAESAPDEGAEAEEGGDATA